MKKFTLFLFLLSCVVTIELTGQESRSKWSVGGSWSFAKDDETVILNSDFALDVDISIGYRIKERFLIGLRPEYNYELLKHYFNWDPKGEESRDNAYALGLFGRYYLPVSPKWQFFLDMNIGYKYIFTKGYWERQGGEEFINYGLGLDFFITKKIAIETLFTLNAEEIFPLRGPLYFNGKYDLKIGFQYFFQPFRSPKF
ncbi:outer membrane beta-barrel protein [Flavilitoribacter nigricans]|nr:outer membrane beta-barrel protein [Flavilitoribacter nigricans]